MEAVLKLRDTRELFEQPERTPLDADYEAWCVAPGAEYLVSILRVDPRARVRVELPADADPEAVRSALARYGRAHAEDATQEIRAQARSGLLALIPTGIVFALALALSKLANKATSHWIAGTIAEALVVVGWVVLWAPVAIFGTDIWILYGRRRAYLRLASNAIEIG